jgi:hypothetical protein
MVKVFLQEMMKMDTIHCLHLSTEDEIDVMREHSLMLKVLSMFWLPMMAKNF